MSIRAVADRIVCVRERLETTEGGLIIPDSAETMKKSKKAIVVSAGPACKYVKDGDTILLIREGTEIDHEGTTYTVVRERAEDLIILT